MCSLIEQNHLVQKISTEALETLENFCHNLICNDEMDF